jgi:hypothetical protein
MIRVNQQLDSSLEYYWANSRKLKIMLPNQTPFPAAWLSIELEGYRDHPELATYSSFSYEKLPSLSTELFRGNFEWLKESEPQESGDEAADLSSQVDRLLKTALQMHLVLPDEFVRFMKSLDLPNRIRSGTDCFFDLSSEIVASPANEGGYLIRFLSDSQGCLFWYLYLTETGEHCIVVSDKLFGSEGELLHDDEEIEDSGEESYICFCAQSFEEFIYRFWIENEVWFALSYDDEPLTQEQENYVAHYKK